MSLGRKLLFTSGVLAVGLTLVAGFGLWYLFIRDDAPPPVSLEAAVEQVSSSSPTATAADDPATATSPATATDESEQAAPEATATSAAEAEATATEGTSDAANAADSTPIEWTVSSSDGSFVGYRIDEELTAIGATTAVGRTSEVTGSVSIEGTTVTAASFEANLQALTSDESFRDNALRDQALETGAFPTATFVLTEPIELGAPLTEGASVSVVARGDLTVHGVTRSVELPLEAQYTGGVLVIVGSLDIVLADFEISQPSAPAVVSVSDTATLEMQLFLSAA